MDFSEEGLLQFLIERAPDETELMSMLTHDCGNQLNTFLGLTRLLMMDLESGHISLEQLQKDLQTIYDAGSNIHHYHQACLKYVKLRQQEPR